MSDEIQKVNLIGINREGIKEDPNFPGRAYLPLRLSNFLDPRWVELFIHEYGLYIHNKKGRLVDKGAD